ncbi:MAG: methyltransferase domain-containing protein [Patescibacteria group bacterium]|nr:methyltransferase domain-containing protein [Patescibacteria group bacterium]
MTRSFYEGGSPEEALELYLAGHDNLYGRMQIQTIKRAMRAVCPSFKNLKILEIGCGGGIWTEFFIKEGAKVTSIDTLSHPLQANKERNPEGTFILGDAALVKINDSFDIVFAKDVIEHIEEDDKFLANMHHHLKEGGSIVIATQNSSSLNYLVQGNYHRYVKRNKNWLGWDPTHVRFYNYSSLSKKLKKAQFRPMRWFGSYFFPYRLFSDHFGKIWESRIFCLIESSPLCLRLPLGIWGWNIGVIAQKMAKSFDKTDQYKFTPWKFLTKLDLLNWTRYAAIVKELTLLKPQRVLEAGPGEGVVKSVMEDFVMRFDTIDVNSQLSPTYEGDIRDFFSEAAGKYDSFIAADILEHIPFDDLEATLKNINAYLVPGGTALITIPHRLHYIFLMTSVFGHKPIILRFPTLKKLLGRKVYIDPYHEWEIGDGIHTVEKVENVMKNAGFKIEKCEKLPYVDFWVLRK